MSKSKPEFIRISETTLLAVEKVMGTNSAASQALKELEERRKNGENPVVYLQGNTYFVGPEIVD